MKTRGVPKNQKTATSPKIQPGLAKRIYPLEEDQREEKVEEVSLHSRGPAELSKPRGDGLRNLRSLRMLPAAARLAKIHTHSAQNRVASQRSLRLFAPGEPPGFALPVPFAASVIPALPVITGVETTEASPPTTLIRWEKRTRKENVRCEERYRAAGAPAWHVRRPCVTTIKCSGHVWIEPAAVVPMGCNISINCLSTLRCQRAAYTILLNYTPAAGVLRPVNSTTFQLRLQDLRVPNWIVTCVARCPNSDKKELVCGTQVLAGCKRAPRGHGALPQPLPLGGRVRAWAGGPGLHTRYALDSDTGYEFQCNTSATACRLLVPPGVRALHVTAHNSKGASGPASVAVSRHPAGDKAPYSQEHQFFWEKVPKQDTLAYIQEEAAAGSRINVSVYAVYPDGVSKPCSGQVFPEEQFPDSTHDDDIGVFLGLGVSVIVLSVVFVILMFKKSARKRINTIIVSLMPKWLLEDFPHVENSNVIKSLQEKSEFARNSFSEPFLDNSDPTIMEIEEMSVHEEYKIVDIGKKHSKAVPEKAACLRSSVPAGSAATEPVSDYKPQLSDGNPLGYVAANIYQTQPHTLAPEPETNVFFRDYTSPITYLWNAEGTEQHAFLLEKINLILNNNRSGQNNAFDSAQEEQNTLLENQWEKTLSSENAQEQTLVPDELVSCLRTMNEESVDIKICFPQSIGRLF
nr:PREDICTED: interleukin-23 receptor [Apteryx mantelli mantelli]